MRMILKGAVTALVLTGTLISIAGAANAAITIGVGLPGISVGFRDGYRDNNNQYHRWHSQRDYRAYRRDHAATYSDWNHDRR
jgi:hypothetical protein